MGPETAPSQASLPSMGAGATLGRYLVIGELGRGGMGVVLHGYDPKLRREVALKCLLSDRLSEDMQARMIQEAHAMAKLSHANVVSLYDFEQIDGRIVLAMEYVDGPTLKTWFGEPRAWTEVLRVFVQAGRGLSAAHRAGLLHRDFKPANVLITEAGEAKVTDFGVARVEEEQLSQPALDLPRSAGSFDDELSHPSASAPLTEAGTVVGTPAYMAPEQHVGESLTAAIDQYAFCVSLWHALTGALPFTGDPDARGERRLTTLARSKMAGPPVWPRGASSIPRAVRDAITRGLSADPAERWPSMDHLLEALAYDPARRRSRVLLGAGALGLLGMSAAGWWSAQTQPAPCTGAAAHLQPVWSDEPRGQMAAAFGEVRGDYTVAAHQRTETALDEYSQTWTAMHTEICEATVVRQEQSSEMMDLRMGCLHRAKVQLGATVEVLAAATPVIVGRAHELVADLPDLARCADLEALQAQVEPPTSAEASAVEAIRARLATVRARIKAVDYDAALAEVETAEAEIGDIAYWPVRLEVLLLGARARGHKGLYPDAEQNLRQALRLAATHADRDGMLEAVTHLIFVVGYRQQRHDEALHHLDWAEGLAAGDPAHEATVARNIGTVLLAKGEYAEAEIRQRRALELREAELGAEHPSTLTARNNLAAVLRSAGRFDEAELLSRQVVIAQERALGPEHPEVARARDNLASVLRDAGRHAEAEAEHRTACASLERALGPEHPSMATSWRMLGVVLQAQGKSAEAEDAFRRSLTVIEAAGLSPVHEGWTRAGLADALHGQSKLEDASQELLRTIALLEKALGPEHPDVAMSHDNLGMMFATMGRHADAEKEHRTALLGLEKALGPEHPAVATCRSVLGRSLIAQDKLDEGEAELRTALSLREASLPPEHPDLANGRYALADVLHRQGHDEEALALAERAWETSEGGPPLNRAQRALLLAELRWSAAGSASAKQEARALAGTASEMLAEVPEDYPLRGETQERLQAWLAEHGG